MHDLHGLPSLTRLPIHLEQCSSPAVLVLGAYISFFEVHPAGVGCVLHPRHAAAPREPHLTGPCEPLFCDVLPDHQALPSAAMGLANLQALTLCFSEPSSLMSSSRCQNYTFILPLHLGAMPTAGIVLYRM